MASREKHSGPEIYCKQQWCTNGDHEPNQATAAIRTKGDDFSLSCGACVQEWELAYPAARLVNVGPIDPYLGELPDIPGLPGRIILIPLTEELASEVRAALAAPAPGAVADPVTAITVPARKQRGRKAAKLVRTALASIALGIILCLAAAPDGREAGNTPDVHVMIFGVLLIVLPLLAGAITIVILIGRELARDIRKERAWKRALTSEQRLGAQAAETAALFAAWAGVHRWVKESNARSAALYQERSAASQARAARFSQNMAASQAQAPAAPAAPYKPQMRELKDYGYDPENYPQAR